MIRECLNALDQKAQEPLEPTPRRDKCLVTNPFQQQAFDERTRFLCNKVLLEAPDELPATVVAVMILFAADFSVVLFRSDFVLVSEKNHVKAHKNQCV